MAKKDTKLENLAKTVHMLIEEIRLSETEGLDRIFMDVYSQQADMMTDSRQQGKVKHAFKDILGIVFFGVLAGNDEWEDIYDFAMDERETLRNYLDLKNGIPSHDTMQRVFAIIRPDELQGMLKEILIQMIEMAGQHLDQYLYQNEELDCYVRDVIAADGKETRHTAKKHAKDPEDLCNLNEFNVMSTEWGVCLSSTRINEKTNEIPEMQAVMKGLDCRKCIVTADAMNAQKETARVIVQEAHGDYCLALKGNQKQAYEGIRNYFACKDLLENIRQKAGQYQIETEESTYTITIREYFITDDIQWFEDRSRWEKLQSIGYERKTITIKETEESHIEERYYLCSIKPIAELFAIAVRRHWNIENNLHWTLDVVFREDSLGSKEKKAVHNLGLIRRFVMFIIKLMKTYYGRSMRRVRKTIGRKPETELPLILAVLRVLYTNDLLDSIDELTK